MDLDPGFDLLLQQRADGAWDLSDALSSWLGHDLDDLLEVARQSGHPDAPRVVATFLVLDWVDREEEEVPASWTPVIEKARDWLRRAMDDVDAPSGFGSWGDWALQFVGPR